MDLLQTLLVYMSMVFATSVQTAPEPSEIPDPADFGGNAAIVVTTTPAPTPVPTIAITPNPAYKTLKMGDKGAEVRELQEKLLEYGYYSGNIDGAYGNQTRKAVEHFQYMHGLSADGIAGRHTQTVLYESNEIRLPQGADPTPTPTVSAQLSVALTPPPTEEPSFVPVTTETPAPTNTPVPSVTPEPIAAEEMTGYTIAFEGNNTDWKAFRAENTVYLPVLKILDASGRFVISTSSIELDEYAFASGMDFVRFTHTENQLGEPIDLQVYVNDEPQLVPDRTLYRSDELLYMPAVSVEKLLDLIVTVDEANKQILIACANE